jgi:hypothetical protein
MTFQVMSSFESMSAVLSPANWGINQPVWAERNYPCDNFIHAFFGVFSNVSDVGAQALQRQTWQCMIAQALAQKQYTEALRSMNTVLVQFWQCVNLHHHICPQYVPFLLFVPPLYVSMPLSLSMSVW